MPARVTRVRDEGNAGPANQFISCGVEYFMNRGWGHLQFSCYGSDAQAVPSFAKYSPGLFVQ